MLLKYLNISKLFDLGRSNMVSDPLTTMLWANQKPGCKYHDSFLVMDTGCVGASFANMH